MDEQKIQLISRLVSGRDLNNELYRRKQIYEFDSIGNNKPHLLQEMIDHGWEIAKEYKTKVKLRRLKPIDVQCEDSAWALFALMGFKVMNRGRDLHIPFNKKDNLTQQIDVFAKDDETVLIVECKSAEKNKASDFKKTLEATASQLDGMRKTIASLFPDETLKFKYILVTKNFSLGEQDKERLKHINGVHLDEDSVEYYTNLYKHLGPAARYQFLGALFHGQDIEGMDNRIPALKGKMGNHTYYSFSVEPEKLLRIGYVLHRSRVNSELMPTYQRLIKKTRLLQVQEFIDEKSGYFPNSIVISIDTNGKKLQFDQANTQVDSTLTSVGILHLPKRYRSAYIIDGQHRLYGYSNSQYKSTNSIPVVAFLNLDREEQVKLFMEINENQKSVPKNLRTTLNSDLLWTSDSYVDKQKALCSRIALNLGENRRSPLFGMVSIGEDKKILTTDAITRALLNSNFVGKASKTKMERLGTFYKGDLKTAYEDLSGYIFLCLEYIKNSLDSSWFEPNSLIVINKGAYALLRVFGDIVDYLLEKEKIQPNSSSREIFLESKRFLVPIINFYENVDEKTSDELRKKYGQTGDIDYWRRLQREIRQLIPEFNPEGLDEYEQNESKEYNEEAYATIRDIEQFLNSKFKQLLIENYGEGWFEEGVPAQIQDTAVILAQQKKREKHREVHPWECLRIIDYRTIALRNWQSIFVDVVTLPDELKLSGGKDAKTQWMDTVSRIRNQNMHSYSVSKEELDFLKRVKRFLIN